MAAHTLFRVHMVMKDGARSSVEIAAATPDAASASAKRRDGVAFILKVKVARK